MSDDEDYKPSCYDCGHKFARRDLQPWMIIVTHDEGLGYDEVPVQLCSDCIGERFDYDCPQCGIPHDDKESARYCCERRPSEAPDCRGCGRRMTVGSASHNPATGTSVTWAECECCPVGWGAYTGWELLDSREPCKHIDTDPRWTSNYNSMTHFQPTSSTDEVLVRMTDDGYNEFQHRECGKVWLARTGDYAPNYCPDCGVELFGAEK